MKKLPESVELETYLRQIPVTLTDAEGKRTPYILQEMNGPKLVEWREFAKARTQTNPDGSMEIGDQKEYHATLIHKCLIPVGDSPERSVEDIYNNFGASTQSKLFKFCLLLNGMMEDEDEEEGSEKN